MVTSNEEAMEIVLEAAKHRASILPFQSDKRKKIIGASRQLEARLQLASFCPLVIDRYDNKKYASHHVKVED
tara:strand:+ start:595 stop:810 length:216 start_codon:yes stop_codon:yes gene_type:complete